MQVSGDRARTQIQRSGEASAVKGLGRIPWLITSPLILEVCTVLDGMCMIRLVLDVKQPAVNGCHGGSESVRPPTVVAVKLSNNLDDAVVRGSRLNNLHTWDLVCSVERYGNLGFGLFGDF